MKQPLKAPDAMLPLEPPLATSCLKAGRYCDLCVRAVDKSGPKVLAEPCRAAKQAAITKAVGLTTHPKGPDSLLRTTGPKVQNRYSAGALCP